MEQERAYGDHHHVDGTGLRPAGAPAARSGGFQRDAGTGADVRAGGAPVGVSPREVPDRARGARGIALPRAQPSLGVRTSGALTATPGPLRGTRPTSRVGR